MQERPGLHLAAFATSLAAGAVTVAGVIQRWATTNLGGTRGVTVTVRGSSTGQGAIVLAAGIVMIAASLAIRSPGGRIKRKAVSMLIAAAAAATVSLTLGVAVNGESIFTNRVLARGAQSLTQAGLPEGAALEFQKRLLAEGKAVSSVSLGAGLWVTLAGGLMGFAGAAVMLASTPRRT